MPELSEEQKNEHRKHAVDCFNGTWDLIDKKDRTQSEIDRMIHMAHASRYHWGQIGTPLEFERGEWQISRVYSILKMPVSAMYHAKRCLEICEENDIADFDIAFAYEAVSRAYAVDGDRENALEYYRLANASLDQIADKNDREYARSELKTIPNLD